MSTGWKIAVVALVVWSVLSGAYMFWWGMREKEWNRHVQADIHQVIFPQIGGPDHHIPPCPPPGWGCEE